MFTCLVLSTIFSFSGNFSPNQLGIFIPALSIISVIGRSDFIIPFKKLAVEPLPFSPLPLSQTVTLSILILAIASDCIFTISGNCSIINNSLALSALPAASIISLKPLALACKIASVPLASPSSLAWIDLPSAVPWKATPSAWPFKTSFAFSYIYYNKILLKKDLNLTFLQSISN